MEQIEVSNLRNSLAQNINSKLHLRSDAQLSGRAARFRRGADLPRPCRRVVAGAALCPEGPVARCVQACVCAAPGCETPPATHARWMETGVVSLFASVAQQRVPRSTRGREGIFGELASQRPFALTSCQNACCYLTSGVRRSASCGAVAPPHGE